MKPFKKHACAIALGLTLMSCHSAMAGTFNFSGDFIQDDNVQFFTFSLSGPTNHLIISTSSFGGADAGFWPLLTLWDAATGTNLGQPPGVNPGVGSPGNVVLDYDFSSLASATSFYLALSVADNAASVNGGDLVGLPSSSFFYYNDLGQSEFTASRYSCAATSGSFWYPDGSDCTQGTGHWALSVSTSGSELTTASPYPPTSVPEPATLGLALAGLAGWLPFARRRLVA